MKHICIIAILTTIFVLGLNRIAFAQCAGDFDRDSDVDGIDMVRFLSDLNRTDCSSDSPCLADIYPESAPDGYVDTYDFALFVQGFGRSDCPVPVPLNLFNIGDSIGEGEAANGTIGSAHHSLVWSTGYESTDIVCSLNERFDEIDEVTYYENNVDRNSFFNHAKSGNVMADFYTQANKVVEAAYQIPDGEAGMITILLGNNDVCAASIETMTKPIDFEKDYRKGLDELARTDATKKSIIHVSGIPAIYWLWVAKHNTGFCNTIWWLGGVCQALLKNPGTEDCESTVSRNDPDSYVDPDSSAYSSDGENCIRRKKFHWKIKTIYNPILRDVLQEYIEDGRLPNAKYVDIFDVEFESNHINNGDCFHPSTEGHAFLADEEWYRSYWGSYDPYCNQ